MRSKIGMILTGGLLMLALSAVTATAASAATPEIVNKEGKALVKTKFTSTLASTTYLFDIKGRAAFSCTGGSGSGEVTGLKTLHASFALSGCEAGGLKLTTKGAPAGEIRMPEINELLVYEVRGTELAPAILFSFPKEVQYGNGKDKMLMKGSFLVEVGASELKEKLSVTGNQTGGVQEGSGEYEEVSGGTIKKASLETSEEGLETFTNVQTGLGFVERLTFEEEFKINA